MVGIMHDGESNSRFAETHQDKESKIDPETGKKRADDKEVWNQIKAEHENGLDYHFRIALTTDIIRLEIFADPPRHRWEELRAGGRKL